MRGKDAVIDKLGYKIQKTTTEKEAPEGGAPSERFPVKGKPTPTPTPTPPRQMTLEEEISQATSKAPSKAPTRTATKEQLASTARSKLESEKSRLESSIYDVARASGRKSLKSGITKALEDRVKQRIAQIDKELEGLK